MLYFAGGNWCCCVNSNVMENVTPAALLDIAPYCYLLYENA